MERRNLINDKCQICCKPIFFRKNSKYPRNDLCSTCFQSYGKRSTSRNRSPGRAPSGYSSRFKRKESESATWGEMFHQGNVSKYSKNLEDEYSSCKVTSTTSSYAPERPPLSRRFDNHNPFRSYSQQDNESPESSVKKMRFHFDNKPVKEAAEETVKQHIHRQKHNPIVFDGETHSNKKFKLVNKSSSKDEAEQDLQLDQDFNNNDSFSNRGDGDLVIDHNFTEAEKDESPFNVAFVNRDPRLQRQNGYPSNGDVKVKEVKLSFYQESVTIKKERMDTGYPEHTLNLNPFMLETCIEGVKFMAELDTSAICLQISMDVAEVIQKEVMKIPAGINRRSGWSNIYPGKVVPVSVDINNFLHVLHATLRSDISYKIILGREVLVTFGYNFSVCGLPVKQKA